MYKYIIEYESKYGDSYGTLRIEAPTAEIAVKIARDDLGPDFYIMVVYRMVKSWK